MAMTCGSHASSDCPHEQVSLRQTCRESFAIRHSFFEPCLEPTAKSLPQIIAGVLFAGSRYIDIDVANIADEANPASVYHLN
jgi:hypothetical protein